jgi:hypothetical protein
MQLPAGTPVGQLAGQVINPSTSQASDGTLSTIGLGHNGDVLMSEVHGRRYAAAARGNLFWGTSGTAGIALDVPGTSAVLFALQNPTTSGRLVEVHKMRFTGASTETLVVAGLALEGGLQTATSVTKLAVSTMPLGGSALSNQATCLGAGTVTALTFLGGLGINITATTGPGAVGEVDFDGTLVLAPGYIINLVSTIDQAADILVCDVFWSEWLP